MYRLFYISNASPFFQMASLGEMCEHSAQKNRELGIGGALVFNGSNFGQILEGEREKVEALYDLIKLDVRHNGINIVSEKTVSERYFQEWGMRLVQGFDFSQLDQAMQA